MAALSGLDTTGLELVLNIVPRLPADVLEAMDHGFLRVHGEPGKSRIIQAERLDILRNALLHVPTGQLFYILADTLHGGGYHFIIAHGGKVIHLLLQGPLFLRLLGLPFSLAFCFGSFMLGTTLFFIGILGCAISGGHICFDVIHIVTSAILFHGVILRRFHHLSRNGGCRIRTRLGCSLVQGLDRRTDDRRHRQFVKAFLFLKGIFARECSSRRFASLLHIQRHL